MTIVVLLLIVSAALLTVLYVVVSHRRRILSLGVDPECLPGIEQSLAQVAGLTSGAVYSGNAVEVLQNGELFTRMIADIQDAHSTVHLETYIWERGALEDTFVTLLSQKAKEGVKIRVLVDAFGARNARAKRLAKLKGSGVELIQYRRFGWFNYRRLNNRMHRKLLVVDGAIGYTFGHGVADQWCGDAESKHHWRDTGVRIVGPVVHPIQSVFIRDWCATSNSIPIKEDCFPKIGSSGTVIAHVVSSSTRSSDSSVALLYMLAIASAKREIIIQNPYFTPDGEIPRLLAQMAQRGVAVHLVLPGENTDSKLVRRAGQRLYLGLLRAGVRIYEFQPTFPHQKIVIIDRIWSHVGTTNFDLRSLALNAEVGVGMLDKDIAAELRAAFDDDLQRSRELTLSEWRERKWYQRAVDWCAYQVRGQI